MARRSARTPEISELLERLYNYGVWARHDPDRPDSSCANPIYANFIPSKAWDEAWGEQVSDDPGYETDVDERDAEAMEVLVLQLPRGHRAIVVRKFVLRHRIPWLDLGPAVRALQDIIAQHWATIDRVEGR